MNHSQLTKKLRQRLAEPLPGVEVQWQMAHAARYTLPTLSPDTAKIAAVLIVLFPKNETTHLVLIERVRVAGDVHGGQMSFPGGKQELTDRGLAHTALREAEEEIGIAHQSLEVLGKLTELYIPVSNFLVHPFVAMASHAPDFSLQPNEVAQIFEIPIPDLYRADVRKSTTLTIGKDIILDDVKYFDVCNRVVWGATAMILSEFLALLE